MERLRWCYIGAGRIAFTTAKELVEDGGIISSVWNRSIEKSKRFAEEFNCKCYENLEDALNKNEIDAAYVNVIHPKHYDLAIKCLEKGIPVLCEKAITMNHKTAEKLFNFAKEKNTYLSEAMWTWHSPIAKKVKEWIKMNEIGKIKYAEGSFAFPMLLFNKNPRLTENKLGGGALLDLGVYVIRYAYELFGYPKSIKCNSKVKNGVDLDDEILFEYDNFKVRLYCSFKRFKGDYFVIHGEKGTIKVPMFHKAHEAYLKNGKTQKIFYKGLLYGKQFSEVEKEISSGNREPKNVSIQGSLDVMKIIDECRAQNGIVYEEDNQ